VANIEGTLVDVGDDDRCCIVPTTTVLATNLLEVRGAPTKRRRINGDMVSTLDRFAKSSACIEQMKMESTIQLHTNNKKLEMDIL
jgi:hypothetical protein